jgi:hypothetical protein
MKLIQTPSLITGVILGASLITLSAASNDSVLGGLNVFVPGTTVSSTEVNANFTYLDGEVTKLETDKVDVNTANLLDMSNLVSYNTSNVASNSSRLDALEGGGGSGNKFFLSGETNSTSWEDWQTIIDVPLGGTSILLKSIRHKGSPPNAASRYAAVEKTDGSIFIFGGPSDTYHGQWAIGSDYYWLVGWEGDFLLSPGEKLVFCTYGSTDPHPYYLNGEYVD